MVKLQKDLVFVKYGSEGKWIKAHDIELNGMTLKEVFEDYAHTKEVLADLLEQLKGHYIVKEDTPYIVNINDKPVKVDSLEVYKVEDTRLPLSFYKIENGKIVLDKKKVGAL